MISKWKYYCVSVENCSSAAKCKRLRTLYLKTEGNSWTDAPLIGFEFSFSNEVYFPQKLKNFIKQIQLTSQNSVPCMINVSISANKVSNPENGRKALALWIVSKSSYVPYFLLLAEHAGDMKIQTQLEQVQNKIGWRIDIVPRSWPINPSCCDRWNFC